MADTPDKTSEPNSIWEPDAIYLTEMDWEDPDYPLVWASISDDSGGTEYRRADLPPTPDQIMADPRVQGLVEALERIAAHSESDAGLMECGTMGVARAALARIRAEGGE
jgi:hypothetical protein